MTCLFVLFVCLLLLPSLGALERSTPASEKCYIYDGERALYKGTVSQSYTFRRCVEWSKINIWGRDIRLGRQYGDLKENHCRDADGSGYPWCFVTNRYILYEKERCDVQSCKDNLDDKGRSLLERCYVLNPLSRRALYDGYKARTLSGRKCQEWNKQQPHEHDKGPYFLNMGYPWLNRMKNYCRDPDAAGFLWCYTKDPRVRWERCDIPYCPAGKIERGVVDLRQCYVVSKWNGGALYVGNMSTTVSGKTCQAWKDQRPHTHSIDFSEAGLDDAGLEKNFCRDFTGEGQPWCYTTSPEVRWERCPVAACSRYVGKQRSTQTTLATTMKENSALSTNAGRPTTLATKRVEKRIDSATVGMSGLSSTTFATKREENGITSTPNILDVSTLSISSVLEVSTHSQSDDDDGSPESAKGPSTTNIIVISVPWAAALALTASAIVIFKRRRGARQKKADGEVADRQRGTNSQWPDLGVETLPGSRLRLHEELGSGQFGTVNRAEALGLLNSGTWDTIAVKVCKKNATGAQRLAFLDEILLMKTLLPHCNVTTYLGASQVEETGAPMILMEFLPGGDLLSWLRRRRDDTDFDRERWSSVLVSFSVQVARGMAHLENQKIVHRDLAARNVLLDGNNVCKVSDFGLARKCDDSSDIYQSFQGAVPFRWMAPESLRDGVFSSKSDVWSYGITVWEILTLGATPYSSLGVYEVITHIMRGNVLEKPDSCDQDLFEVVSGCWRRQPDQRPSFAALEVTLHSLSEKDAEHTRLDHFDPRVHLVLEAVSDREVI